MTAMPLLELDWEPRRPLPGEHSAGTVQLWLVDLLQPEAVLPSLLVQLSPAERAQASRYQFDRHRRRFIVRRAALRGVLGAYLACEPRALAFDSEPHGKPVLAAAHSATELCFNASSSQDTALIAVRRDHPLGVDIASTVVRFDVKDLANSVFTAHERAWLTDLGDGDSDLGFFRMWSCKEAYIKLDGRGLSRELQSFSLAPVAHRARLLACVEQDGSADDVTVMVLEAAGGHAAALATRSGFTRVQGFAWAASSSLEDDTAPHSS